MQSASQSNIPAPSENTQSGLQRKTTAILIANPKAGSYTQHVQQVEETLAYLQEQGWDAELKLTRDQGDARKLTREAVEQKRDVVVSIGGDGTINEVIQELAGSETALGVLPSGTVNVWARETGIPLDDYTASREVLINGRTRRIDLGTVDQRYFLMMSTVGFDAQVTHVVENKPKKRFGVFMYILNGLQLALGYPNFSVALQVGKRRIRMRALQVIIGNTQLYGGAIKFTWEAKADDGLLDVCVVRGQNIFGRLGVLLDFLLRRKQREQWVRYDASEQIQVWTVRPVAIQTDGDPSGFTGKRGSSPTTFKVAPGVLKVIVPQQVPENLFTKP